MPSPSRAPTLAWTSHRTPAEMWLTMACDAHTATMGWTLWAFPLQSMGPCTTFMPASYRQHMPGKPIATPYLVSCQNGS